MQQTSDKNAHTHLITMGCVALALCLPDVLSAEVILLQDPTVQLSQPLATWTDDAHTAEPRWRPRVGSDRSFVAHGLIQLSGEGRLEVPEAFNPADFPYIRFRAGGSPARERMIHASASPYEEANRRSAPITLANGGGQFSHRLPPEQILAKAPYDGKGLRLEIEDSNENLALDYILADARPAYALAEFDSDYPEPYDLENSGFAEAFAIDGCLRLNYNSQVKIHFKEQLPTNRDYDTLELRLRIPTGKNAELTIEWKDGDQIGQHTVPLSADSEFHTYRLHLYKEPNWTERPEQLSLHFNVAGHADNTAVDIDYVRLYDLPNPGGGNISSGLLALNMNPEHWSQTAQLVDRWRFVAGQSYKGNQARMWKGVGRSFQKHKIRWETDHATWQWLIERDQWPRKANGEPDLKAAAQLAYADINPSAVFLEKRGARLDAVHFDGLFKRLLLPRGNPHSNKSHEGGLLEFAKGDYNLAFRLAAETFCEFMVLARTAPDSALKETHFYIQPNFHVWGWAYGIQNFKHIFTNLPDPGNFREMIDALEATDHAYAERGAYKGDSPFAGYGADWVFMNAQKRRLAAFEWYATEICRREFNVINNGTLKGDSPAERSQESLDYLRQFRAEGGRPTSYTPYYWQTTWRKAPDYGKDGHAVLPEDKPSTVTWTLLHSARLALFMQPHEL